ncbi:MAG: WYL domain-containing protein [bacterium]|nr:WYL domain-containing protein [bacterium]
MAQTTYRTGHYRPSERLLALLILLSDHRWHITRHLAEQFETAERTLYRDLDKIENATKLSVERQTGRGVRLVPGRTFAGLEGGTEEALNLIFAVVFSPKLGFSLVEVARTLDKLRASLPLERTAWIDWLRSRIHFEIPIKSRGVQFMKVIRTGIVECRRLRLTHIGVGDTVPDRHDVNPYGVVYHHDVWYLLGFDCKCGERRAFRVDRFKTCTLLDLKFVPPEDFDAREYWNRSFWRQYERDAETFVVTYDADYADRVKHWNRVQLKSHADGSVEATFKSMNPEWVKSFILSCGAHCLVRSPEWLKNAVKEQAEKVTHKYSRNTI